MRGWEKVRQVLVEEGLLFETIDEKKLKEKLQQSFKDEGHFITNKELNLDVDSEFRDRACHRVMRALHDGSCPNCGHTAPASQFHLENGDDQCPYCKFIVPAELQREIAIRFVKTMRRSVEVFNDEYGNWKPGPAAEGERLQGSVLSSNPEDVVSYLRTSQGAAMPTNLKREEGNRRLR